MLGTVINAAAIITGSTIGILIHNRLPRKISDIMFQGMGLITLSLGISMSLKSENFILVILSIVIGAIIGQGIDIDGKIDKIIQLVQRKTQKGAANDRFTEGFITSSVLFCVGSMTILGSIEDGLGNEPTILLTKSVMDGITSLALATSFGLCIIFSAIPVFIVQGLITVSAATLMHFAPESLLAEMTAVGGVLLIGLGLSILNIKKINVTNMIPSLLVIVILIYFLTL